jgi:hypothetical protein
MAAVEGHCGRRPDHHVLRPLSGSHDAPAGFRGALRIAPHAHGRGALRRLLDPAPVGAASGLRGVETAFLRLAGRARLVPHPGRLPPAQLLWDVQIFFLGLPGWFIAIGLYVGLSSVHQRRVGFSPAPVPEET